MGRKQALTDQPTDSKKRRRVGFAPIDIGVEANDCIKIFLVKKKEEVGVVDESSLIEPIDLNHFFDNEGRIFGYQDLKINIYLSIVSFHAYADITFQSTSDGGKGITDLKPALQKIFGESLVENKDNFLQTFSSDIHYIRNIISNGEVLHREDSGNNKNSDTRLEADSSLVEHQVIRMTVDSISVGELYCRLVPLVLLLVDASSPIDVTDPSWEIYLAVESTKDDQGDGVKLLGFVATYRFYYYPDSSRLRLSQILVLPPYQGQGYGRLLMKVVNSVAQSENVYDLSYEEPSEYLQQVRTCIDIHRVLALEPVKGTVTSVALHIKEDNESKKTSKLQFDPPATVVEDVRRSLKINKKHFLQCWEILVYLELDQNDSQCMDTYRNIISEHTKFDLLGKNSDDAGKQIVEVPNDYDHEMTFVMFRPTDNVKVDNVNAEIQENQNLEQQLKQLVDERMKEIGEIAQKVSLHSQ